MERDDLTVAPSATFDGAKAEDTQLDQSVAVTASDLDAYIQAIGDVGKARKAVAPVIVGPPSVLDGSGSQARAQTGLVHGINKAKAHWLID